MKNLLSSIFLSSFLFCFLSGCSKAPGKTETKFKIGISAIVDINIISAGGAMLWGRSDQGDMFGSVINPATPLDLNLPNANWTFWTVAWHGDGSGAKFSGLIRCSKNSAILNGAAVEVNIALNNANCAIPDFSPSVAVNAGINTFPDISHYECNRLINHNGVGCGIDSSGGTKSVTKRLVLQSFIKPRNGGVQVLGEKLISNCYPVDGYFIKEQLPLSNGVLPALTFLESFYSSNSCDEADPKGFRRAAYQFGLFGTARLDTIRFINEGTCDPAGIPQPECIAFGGSYSASCSMSTSLQKEISQAACEGNGGTYTATANSKKFELIATIPDEELCSGPRVDPSNVTPHPFASGTGVLASPFTICTEVQMNKIGLDMATYSASSFSLAAHLNMDRTSSFGDLAPVACSAGDPGANFMPIGGLYDNTVDCNEVAAIAFTGNFNGQHHSIANIRLRAKVDDVGFIRSGGSVSNLTLKHMEVEGRINVGAVSGLGSTSLKNITLIDAEVRGNDYVGGVVGRYSGNTNPISNVHAREMYVWSESNPNPNVGGLVADSNSSAYIYIEKSSFEGVLSASYNGEKLGGLLGSGTSGVNVNISNSYSSGVILTSQTSGSVAGGLVGSISGVVNINGSYSKMSIGPAYYSTGLASAQIGGLVGFSSGSITINDSFYYGSIMLPCRDTTNTICPVGSLSSNLSATGSNKFGAQLNESWFAGNIPTDNTTLTTMEAGALKSTLIATTKFKEVGSLMPKISWEIGTCALTANNATVAVQSVLRGSLINPIVLCNKEQWRDIRNFPALNYELGDNLSLGELTSADMAVNFSGSLNGKGRIVSGFKSSLSTGDGGLFKGLSGKISHVNFMTGFIKSTGANNIGVVGVNNGVIENNVFESVNIMGPANSEGVVAGVNNGTIYLNTVESYILAQGTNVGLVVGDNSATGTITGATARGEIRIQNAGLPVGAGGIVGVNTGIISEVEMDAKITNEVNTNTSARIGLLVGMNMNTVLDALIKPWASLNTMVSGAKLGQVFGYSGASSISKRIVSANEIAMNSNPTMFYHFVAEHTGGAVYENAFALIGGVFEFNSASPLTNSACIDQGSGAYAYNMNANFNNDVAFPDGYYVSTNSGGGGSGNFSKRITGTHTDSTVGISSSASDLTLVCGANGFQAGSTTYQIKSSPDFVMTGVVSTTPANFKLMTTFCPSSSSEVGNLNYSCPATEFDMVEDNAGGIGFNRLLSAHMYWEQNGMPPAVRPVWTMSDEGYPRLFITD